MERNKKWYTLNGFVKTVDSDFFVYVVILRYVNGFL